MARENGGHYRLIIPLFPELRDPVYDCAIIDKQKSAIPLRKFSINFTKSDQLSLCLRSESQFTP